MGQCRIISSIFREVCIFHDDVTQWKHFPRYWPFVQGIHRWPGEFPAQRPVTRSFDVFFDLRLNKRLSKQSWGRWFETPSRSLWRHCNVSQNLIVTEKAMGTFHNECHSTMSHIFKEEICQQTRHCIRIIHLTHSGGKQNGRHVADGISN